MGRTITVETGAELKAFIDSLLEDGSYKTTSEVVRDGLRLLQEQVASSKLTELRTLIEEGDASPSQEWKPDAFMARMREKYGTQH